MSVINTNPRFRLPDQVDINFGPVDVLGPAFLKLDRAMRDSGIYLSISRDFRELASVNERYRDDWYKLLPMFDHSLGGISEENGFWIYGVDERGEIVIVQAARLYLWPDTTFADEWCDRTFIYEDPERQGRADEQCSVSCDAAHRITGRVCHTGALWMRSDYRRQGVTAIMPRLVRAYAATHWYPDYMFGMIQAKPELTPKSITRLVGWKNVDLSIRWGNSPHRGDIDIAVCWMDTPDAIEDVRRFTESLKTERTAPLAHAA